MNKKISTFVAEGELTEKYFCGVNKKILQFEKRRIHSTYMGEQKIQISIILKNNTNLTNQKYKLEFILVVGTRLLSLLVV